MPSHSRGPGSQLSIRFFTIVLNGEPFIRYHETVFRRLTVPWHWHIVEGVAELAHDTAWSVTNGGHIDDSLHDHGRSNDGTTAYLDDLAARLPDKVTIYRKPPDVFWDGKREMVNAPLANINDACLLWQIDADELWTAEQIETVHGMFAEDPSRTAAWYWCWYYVGPDKIISTRRNYAQNPDQEWLRTWRFEPGAVWASHEPPGLVRGGAAGDQTDIAKVNPFTQDEMEQAGAVFHHFAYATEAQAGFKERYYGYKGVRERWRALRAHSGSGLLRDYFEWVTDNTVFDDPAAFFVDPIARPDRATGEWRFDGAGMVPAGDRGAAVARPRIVVDGIFWQYLSSGIGRVWENLLREWVASGFAEHVILLDRGGTAPRIPGVHYWTAARHDYAATGRDSLYLEELCRQLDADVFVSTYYSTPVATPSFFSGYDMIPEVLGFPLRDETWKEKRRAILHASAHCMISRNSADDLERLYPCLPAGGTYVAYCGVAPGFGRPDEAAIAAFLTKYQLRARSYVLMVGERIGYGGYKNGSLAFRALALSPPGNPTLLCVGGGEQIEPDLRALASGRDIRRVALNDQELAAAYAGALALVYPSKYEGFGMPPLESMACGTPAIVCRTSSIPEVVGDAALYVDADDPAGMADAIMRLQDPAMRADLVERGLRQAAGFTFVNMARDFAAALVTTHERLRSGAVVPPNAAWSELREFQRGCQDYNIDLDVTPAERIDAGTRRSAAERDLARARETIAAMRNSPFWKARELTVRLLRKTRLRGRA